MTAVIFRRRALGYSSCRTICNASDTGIVHARVDQPNRWPADTSTVFRWGCTANIPVDCDEVVNTAEAIHLVNDKAGFRELLNEHRLCPDTWDSAEQAINALADYPLLVRPGHHAQGRYLYVCADDAELYHAARDCGPHHYVSEIIDKVAEYRIFVVQGRVLWVSRKVPRNPDEIVWNHHSGNCTFENVRWGDWPLQGVRKAVEAFNLSGLDFGGVDVIQDAEGTCYVLEINSASTQESEYRNSLIAKAFDNIVIEGKEHIPVVAEPGGWRKWGHPALSPEIIIPNEQEIAA